MTYLFSFIFVGLVCLIAQIILDNTKLTAGHITTIFVIIGSFLDVFDIYDKIIKTVGFGANVPITSFGHLLCHGAISKGNELGFLGYFEGVFDLTGTGIAFAIIVSFFLGLIFKPKS